MLHVSSALFATAVVHAYLKKHTLDYWYFSPSQPKLEPDFMNIFWACHLVRSAEHKPTDIAPVSVLLVLIAAILSVYLTVFCDWSKSYPTEHAVLAFHCIIAGLPC